LILNFSFHRFWLCVGRWEKGEKGEKASSHNPRHDDHRLGPNQQLTAITALRCLYVPQRLRIVISASAVDPEIHAAHLSPFSLMGA
jgi:hypothetical protein